MRLTLRTLLAWKDDTLQPNQVREIGRQVAESPFAQELSDRIDRVTRQRRLSVPSNTGPDAADPNIVASYLDNDLDPDAVAEFEKKCLTSDVNLAEVASVHQILSLLGQKVKVPDEARSRMYQLVKGREALKPRGSAAPRRAEKEPVTRPIQPWVLPEAPKRPWIERYGPAAACILLIGLSIWAAWRSVGPEFPPPTSLVPPGPGGPEVAAAGPEAAKEKAAVEPGAEAPRLAAAVEPAKAEPEPAATPKAAVAEAAAAPNVPSGSAGVAEKPDGILLRYNEEKREWDRLVKEAPLKTSDHLLCLTPFRAWITVGKIRIGLVAETEVRVLSRPSDPVPAIELLRGRLLIRQPASNELKVVFAKRAVDLDLSSDAIVGMERVNSTMMGQPVSQPQPLGILCQQGEVTVKIGEKSQVLKSLNLALVDAAAQVQTGSRESLPPWVAQPVPSPLDMQLSEQFLKVFHADRPVLAEIVAALDDDRPEIKQPAINALGALGDLSLLMPILSRPDDPIARRTAISVIQAYMAQGPEASGRMRQQLDDEFQNLGGIAYHMLIGFTPEEVSRPDFYPNLVGLLSPEQESIGIRELAIYTLKGLTGRDDMGYDPDHPAKGFEAWSELLRRDELRAPAPRAAKSKNAR